MPVSLVTLNTAGSSYTSSVILARTIQGFLTGILTIAVLNVTPGGLVPSVHSEMSHDVDVTYQNCLSGCMSGSPELQTLVSNQGPKEEQSKDAPPKDAPYYTRFFSFYVPRSLVPTHADAAMTLRLPDLVILHANYLS
jgi:hypothetical protein